MKKTITVLGTVLIGFYLVQLLLTQTLVRSTSSPSQSADLKVPDMTISRVPIEALAAAKSLKNPVPPTAGNIARGKSIFTGRGACHTCHGPEGRGDGPSGVGLFPPPRDFTDHQFAGLRTDGELYWVIIHGSPGSSMFAYAPQIISEEDAWYVVTFLQTIAGPGRRESPPASPEVATPAAL